MSNRRTSSLSSSPRLTRQSLSGFEESNPNVKFSDKYRDEEYEYTNVEIPEEAGVLLPKRLLSEEEWRRLGINLGSDWEHYAIYPPKPHVLFFRTRYEEVNPLE